jgi:hypothetical protein
MKVLAKEAAVRVNGQWRVLQAILVTSLGGSKVIYLDKDGFEVYSEALCKSQFKKMMIKEAE